MNLGLFLLIILILIGVFIFLYFFKFKRLVTPNVYMVDGGVKTGKSLCCVYLSIRQYKRNCRKVFIRNLLVKFINLFLKKDKKKYLFAKPMLYSNMPLNRVKYNDLTLDIIERKVRIPYLSVCLIDEASLVASSMSGYVGKGSEEKKKRFDYINEKLTLFIKLYGHYTKNGSLFYNSQSISDLHFAFKRCTSTYLMIYKRKNYPFVNVLYCREFVHSEDSDSVNVINQDLDQDFRRVFILKKYFKYYNRFYLSALTDNKNLYVDYNVPKYIPKKYMGADKVLTLDSYKEIEEFNNRGVKNEKE